MDFTSKQREWLRLYFFSFGCYVDDDRIHDLKTGEHIATVKHVEWDRLTGVISEIELVSFCPVHSVHLKAELPI